MENLVIVEFAELLERLSFKYSDFTQEDLVDVIEFSVFALRKLSNNENIDLTDYNNRAWIKRCCYEQLDKMERGLFAGIKSYSENGYSFTLDSGDISLALQSLIVPKAKCFTE